MEQGIKIVLIVLSSYLLGAIPSSYIMGRLMKGIDLRNFGSGNLGAANAFRVLGAKAAIPVFLIDIGKGFLAVRIVSFLGMEYFIFSFIAALIVILGHNYSVFVNFSGGKGVGTTTGAFAAMAPLAVGICFVIWLILLFIFRIVSVASVLASSMLPVMIFITNRFFDGTTHVSIIYLSIFVAIMVVYKHRSNFKRLINGEEGKIF